MRAAKVASAIIVLTLLSSEWVAAQGIKIVDANFAQGMFTRALGQDVYSFCYAVQTFSSTKSRFRIYDFDSVAHIQSTIDLDAYGEYELISYSKTGNYKVVTAYSKTSTKLAVWFVRIGTNQVEGPIMLTIADKKPKFQIMEGDDLDLSYVLVESVRKKNSSTFRLLAISPSRITWETEPKVIDGSVLAWTCEGKIIVRFAENGHPATSKTLSQTDGSPVELEESSKCLQKPDPSYSVGQQIALGAKKILWVGKVTTAQGSYLIGEEYAFDGSAGQVAGGAVAALTGVYGAVPSTLRFLDVVIQPLTEDKTNRPQPRFIPMAQRNVLLPSGLTPSQAASTAFRTSRNRYVGPDKNGKARFVGTTEVMMVDVDTGETSVFGRFYFKDKIQSVVCVSSSGLVIRGIDEQTAAISFRHIPFE